MKPAAPIIARCDRFRGGTINVSTDRLLYHPSVYGLILSGEQILLLRYPADLLRTWRAPSAPPSHPKPSSSRPTASSPTMVPSTTTAPIRTRSLPIISATPLRRWRPARTKDDRDEEPRLQHQIPRPDRKAVANNALHTAREMVRRAPGAGMDATQVSRHWGENQHGRPPRSPTQPRRAADASSPGSLPVKASAHGARRPPVCRRRSLPRTGVSVALWRCLVDGQLSAKPHLETGLLPRFP
jgi:hypothetical protein